MIDFFCACSAEAFLLVGYLQLKLEAIDKTAAGGN
jgi:hypothetical protein